MITFQIIFLYLLELGEVTLVDLVKCLILPTFRRFAVPGEGVVDLNETLVTKHAGSVHQSYKSRDECN